MKKLPLGIQTFSEIIDKNYLYVDKTCTILPLIAEGKYYFLSRPRRFGKSLLVSTLKEIFLGNRELFKGLYIYDKIAWEKHPVIHLDFSIITYDKSPEIFEESLSRFLVRTGEAYNIHLSPQPLKDQFLALLAALSRERQVVVLIDEYDKPIIDHITDPEKATANREVLRNFYTVLKNADPYLRFVFLTGVSKFSKVSVFSGLNNLTDITLNKRFAVLTGITQEELLAGFTGYLGALAKSEGLSGQRLLEVIRYWYNGYSWDGINYLYNPTSLLNLFFNNSFANFWFATGTPSFLIKLIKARKIDIAGIENKVISSAVMDSYDIDNIELYPLLFQTGYLTITEVRKIGQIVQYKLNYPDFEVKESFLNHLLASFSGCEAEEIQPLYMDLLKQLADKDIPAFQSLLTGLFARIPYQLHIPEERYYHSLCYMILALLGADIHLEVSTNKGRIDGVLELERVIYVIEFKMGTAREALAQIKEKRYWEPYIHKGKELFLLGIGGFREKLVDVAVEELL